MPQPLDAAALQSLHDRHPGLPDDYVAYMATVGWGKAGNGRMIYSGPIEPGFVYPEHEGPAGLLLFGDDLMGYCVAWDGAGRVYGELDPCGRWNPWPVGRGLAAFVAT